jgi:hypothetical protein
MKVLFAASTLQPCSRLARPQWPSTSRPSLAMPESPSKMAVMKEIGCGEYAMSKGDMRGACKSYMRAQKWVRRKVESFGTMPTGSHRQIFNAADRAAAMISMSALWTCALPNV